VASPADEAAAASQDCSPFVLVTGLLLIGRVANDDGQQLARVARTGGALFAGAAVMIGVATATLNLDTTVAFLTPVLVHTATSRGGGDAPLPYGCLLPSNAGSLFLVGSNLTNLIVLGRLHLSGAGFLARMRAPALAALVVTAAVVERAAGTGPGTRRPVPAHPQHDQWGPHAGLVRTARCPAGYTEARWCVAVRRARSRGLLLGEGWTFPVESASRENRSRLPPP
jgi:hypothetical protein